MTPQCRHPDLQMAVLREARRADALPPELAQHLEECTPCQGEVTRKRRMADVWSGDAVTEEEVTSALRRFYERRATPRRSPAWFDVVPFGAAGAVASYALLLATHTIHLPWSPTPSTRELAASVASHVEPRFAVTAEDRQAVLAKPHVETARGVAPLEQGLRIELNRGESARVSLADGKASLVEGPCLLEFWSAPLEVGGFTFSREELGDHERGRAAQPIAGSVAPTSAATSTTTTLADETSDTPAAPALRAAADPSSNHRSDKDPPRIDDGIAKKKHETSPRSSVNVAPPADARALAGDNANPAFERAWARAAAALNEDDFAGADRAFSELGQAPDPATRDAARLSRAQLWIAHGRGDAVRSVLEQLAASGATPLVRRNAAEFLARTGR